MVQAATMVSAYPIIAIDLHDNRLELASKLGATHVINSIIQNTEAEIWKIVGKRGVDVTLENTGVPEVVELAYRITNSQGRTVLVGVMTKGQSARIYTYPLHFDQKIIGSSGGHCRPEIDIPNYVRLCEVGKLDFKELIGRRYSLDQINEAITDMKSGGVAGRCMITMADE
jgi:Zn-dependent alcohol dehydrogenase